MKTEQIVIAIIKEQSQIIGDSLAQHMALSTGVVKFSSKTLEDISITSQDQSIVIQKLVEAYKSIFGQASVEVCNKVINKYTKL